MARIVQSLTQPRPEYDQRTQESFVRDVDSVIQKLNTTFQQEIKEEAEALALFLG
jgi:hypothetical protein